jgi:MFS family permease
LHTTDTPVAAVSVHKSSTYGWYSVGLLSFAMAISLVDRFALSLLFQPIKLDLGLTDTQLGLLHGIAFGLFYAFMGVPLGWAVDKLSRKWIICWGILLWSAATALCGTARSYVQLLGARIGVGVGEAALSPAGYSIITDTVPRQHLGKAISVFQMGAVMGGGLALALGGKLYAAAQAWDLSAYPLLAGMAPWRITFILLAVPGLLLALMVALMREPQRAVVATSGDTGVLRFMSADRALWIWFFLGNACLVSISYANLTWAPTLLIRQYGWTAGEAGWRMGLAMMIVAPAGVVLGGWLADTWRVRHGAAGFVRVLQLCPLLAVPCVLATQLGSSASFALCAIIAVQFVISLVVGVGPALVQVLVPPLVRGRVSAVYVLVVNLVGLGIGPVVVGSLSDHLFTGVTAVARAVGAYSAVMLIVALVSVTALRKRIR